MGGCLPLVISWIYQRFPCFYPPDRDLVVFPLVSRVDTHARRMLEFQNELDRVGVDDFVWTPYMAPQWRVIEPGWVNDVGEIETWMATVPIVLFMYIRFHHVDRMKRQFRSEQAIPLDPVNLDGFLRASARGDDKWWPDELAYWYGFWHNRRSRDHQIQIVPTHYPGWPTREYADWWASPDRLLQDPRGAQLLDDVPPAATQERDPIVLPRHAPARRRRAQMQRPDIRRKGEGAFTSGRSDTMLTRRLSTIDMRTFQRGLGPRIRGDGHAPHVLAWFILQGESSGSRSAPHPPAGAPSGQFNCYGPPNDMYDVFSYSEQMIDHIAHEFITSRTSDDAVYRPGPPLQPHHDLAQQSLAAVVPSALTAAGVSAALALFLVVLPAIIAVGLSVTFIGSTALPAPVQLSPTVAPATALSECGTTFTPPAAARRSVLPHHAGAIGPPDCPPTGTAATEGSPSTPMRHIIPSPPSPSARGRPGLGSGTFLI
ncbi:hypothetical protein PIB30_066069 [Stylosanthes scabra]|uniref:Aminotransferase-like plant mobile domain-containing protein n=1 Tax=Stylosanthes scabra TaxID=79078 RepID=A0ABU6UQ43_9FABA|nr:hypothetical protein [Stylosanthes scabra]